MAVAMFGWKIPKGIYILKDTDRRIFNVVSGAVCEVIGLVYLLLTLMDKTILLLVIVLSSLSHTLVENGDEF